MHKSPSMNEGVPCSPVGSSSAAVRRTALQVNFGSGEGYQPQELQSSLEVSPSWPNRPGLI